MSETAVLEQIRDDINFIKEHVAEHDTILEDDPEFERRTRESLERVEAKGGSRMSKEEFLKEIESW